MTDNLCPQPCMCPSCYDFEEVRDFLEWQKRRADLSPSPEVVKELVEAAKDARAYLAGFCNEYSHSGAVDDALERLAAVLAKLEGGE